MSLPVITHINFNVVYYFVIYISFYGIPHLISDVVLCFDCHNLILNVTLASCKACCNSWME